MNESSTRNIDAIWIVHSAKSDRCYLKAIFSEYEAFIGPEMRGIKTNNYSMRHYDGKGGLISKSKRRSIQGP
jgi:hypothetical protein